MWHGKNKALTFSFDDGVRQDIRAVEILNRYGLKATFNLNSGCLGLRGELIREGKRVRHDKVNESEVKSVYAGHEIAVHTLTHPHLNELDEETIVRQVEEDRKALEKASGQRVCGMAYPYGDVDDRVAGIIAAETPVRYARAVESTYDFELQENLLQFRPTVHFTEACLTELAERFLSLNTDRPQLFYVWGHTYELDYSEQLDWEAFERFCKLVSGKDDIYYGTNQEVLL